MLLWLALPLLRLLPLSMMSSAASAIRAMARPSSAAASQSAPSVVPRPTAMPVSNSAMMKLTPARPKFQ